MITVLIVPSSIPDWEIFPQNLFKFPVRFGTIITGNIGRGISQRTIVQALRHG